MPILTLQRRLREIGRIRAGDTATGQNGKSRPRKLAQWRLTSPDRSLIDKAAAAYGGEPESWHAPDGQEQAEVYTATDRLRVLVPPADMAFTQWYETWSAGGCSKRCDGERDVLRDVSCDCDPEVRECKMTSRLSVLLPDVPGIGTWRLESHGYYAAVELAAAVEVCQRALAAGMLLPAWLRLEQRTVKRIDAKGKPVTLKYAVPVLDVDAPLSALTSPGALTSLEQLAEPENGTGAVWQPISELPAAPFVSVADQLEEVERPRKRRANAPAEMPDTGMVPQTAEEDGKRCAVCGERLEGTVTPLGGGTYAHSTCAAAARAFEAAEAEEQTEVPAPVKVPPERSEGAGGGMSTGVMRSGDPSARTLTTPTGGASAQQRALMHALAAEVLAVSRELPDETRKAELRRQRLAICAALGFAVESTSELTAQQMSRLIDALRDIGEGTLWLDGDELRVESTGGRRPRVTPSVVDVETGEVL